MAGRMRRLGPKTHSAPVAPEKVEPRYCRLCKSRASIVLSHKVIVNACAHRLSSRGTRKPETLNLQHTAVGRRMLAVSAGGAKPSEAGEGWWELPRK